MPATFQDLPVELYDQIASYLPHSALSRLARCSRESFAFFGSKLYNKLILYGLDGCEISLINETLIKRPFLAGAVREIHVEKWLPHDIHPERSFGEQPWWTYSDEESEDEKTCGQPYLHLFLDHIWRATRTRDEQSQWVKDLLRHDADACLGLLLILVPRLRKLKIRYPGFTSYVPWIIGRASDPAFNFLPLLSRVYAAGGTAKSLSLDYTVIAPFFKLPSIRKVYLHRMYNDCSCTSDIQECAITHLELKSSAWRFFMRDVVRSCTNLVSLKYEQWGGHCVSNRFGYSTRAFYNSIYPARHTLQHLWLDFGPRFKTAGRKPIPPLHEFTSLTKLHLPSYYLAQFNEKKGPDPCDIVLSHTLPFLLEELEISRVNRRILHQVANILERHIRFDLAGTPGLARIAIEGRLAPNWRRNLEPKTPEESTLAIMLMQVSQGTEKDVASLAIACGEAGIRFAKHDRNEKALHCFEEYPFYDKNRYDLSNDVESELEQAYPLGSDDSAWEVGSEPD